MLSGNLNADPVGKLHEFVRNQVADAPAFVDRKLLDVGYEEGEDLLLVEYLAEVDAALDALHSHGVLLVGVEVGEDVEQILLGHRRDKLDHAVQHLRRTLPHLGDLVLGSLGEEVDDVLLVGGGEVGVNDWEELNGRVLGGVGLPIHEALDHLDDLLLHFFYVYDR